MAELKPCPFCGGEPWIKQIYKTHIEKTRWVVKCTKCNAFMEYRSEKSVCDAWNRRTNDAEIEELKAEIELMHEEELLRFEREREWSEYDERCE